MSNIHFQLAAFFRKKKIKKSSIKKQKTIVRGGNGKRWRRGAVELRGFSSAPSARPSPPLSFYRSTRHKLCTIHSAAIFPRAVTWHWSPDPQLAEELDHNKFVSVQLQLHATFSCSSHEEKVTAVFFLLSVCRHLTLNSKVVVVVFF